MRASYCEQFSCDNITEKGRENRTRSYIRHDQAGNPIRLDIANKHLGICRAMRKMERNKGRRGAVGELFAANLKPLFWLALANYQSLYT